MRFLPVKGHLSVVSAGTGGVFKDTKRGEVLDGLYCL